VIELLSVLPFKFTCLVYQVNWLRAKACVDRWLEEETLVKHEMEWTVIWFKNQAKLWGRGLRGQTVNCQPDINPMQLSSRNFGMHSI